MENKYKDIELHDKLEIMTEKYKDNEYVYGRLLNYIHNLLPTALETEVIKQKQRNERFSQLNADKDEFTCRFLKTNNYFYSIPTELFLHYDGLHFVLQNEDDIHHQILSTISSEKCLRDWKHKVNKNILKKIKEKSPLNAIPESSTIQFVINTLCPSIFPTRNHVKYFLTIIGECLSMKNISSTNNAIQTIQPSNIYIFPLALKEIMREIGNQCYIFFGFSNLFTNIKYKYYDHNYINCRLLNIDRCFDNKKIEIPSQMQKFMLDFLCVSSHYATRYGTSDNFLNNCSELKLVEHAYFLTKNDQDNIISCFIDKSLTLCASSVIDSKNMIFLWKKYLNDLYIPNIIFHESLKNNLKNKIKYNEETDCFTGVTSIHLPIVSQFITFWEETIREIDNENNNIDEYSELEIDEICVLFKYWGSTMHIKGMNDKLLLDLIKHFYTDLDIENNKYILNIKSTLWNKHDEVINVYNKYKENNDKTIDPYEFYGLEKKNIYNLLVSKRFFEKTIFQFEKVAHNIIL